jgi:hypothetical protein
MSAASFFRRMDDVDSLTAYAVHLDTPGLAPLNEGLGQFNFIDLEKAAPPRVPNYATRMFLYKGSYTDWHFHSSDETITVQLLSRKELLLLPTDNIVFRRMRGALQSSPGWLISLETHPEFAGLIPLRAVLQPGDAVYLPVFWWHAFEAVGNELGVTLAFTFGSPLDIQCDPRFAAARSNIRFALAKPKYRRYLPLLVFGGFASLLRHPFRPRYLSQHP